MQILQEVNVNQTQRPLRFNFQGEPTITALEVRRQKEEELKKNDLYWSKRLQQQEETLKQTQLLLETEYKKTVSSIFSSNVPIN